MSHMLGKYKLHHVIMFMDAVNVLCFHFGQAEKEITWSNKGIIIQYVVDFGHSALFSCSQQMALFISSLLIAIFHNHSSS